jgi:hypothetical protein
MKEFNAGNGQFEGWDQQKRSRCFDRIAGTIVRRSEFRVAVGVDRVALDEILAPIDDGPIGPYGFCVFEWMHEAERSSGGGCFSVGFTPPLRRAAALRGGRCND